jgi:DNA-binding response OmpR family regulator
MKIFILEDFDERINYFKNIFSDCDIDYTDDVKYGFDLLSSKKYDLIFLDRDLGKLNESGEDLAWEMLQHKIASNTPIIIHTENTRGQRIIKRYLEKYHNNVKQIAFKHLRRMSKEEIIK